MLNVFLGFYIFVYLTFLCKTKSQQISFENRKSFQRLLWPVLKVSYRQTEIIESLIIKKIILILFTIHYIMNNS